MDYDEIEIGEYKIVDFKHLVNLLAGISIFVALLLNITSLFKYEDVDEFGYYFVLIGIPALLIFAIYLSFVTPIKKRKFKQKVSSYFYNYNKENGYAGTKKVEIKNDGSFKKGVEDILSSGNLKKSGNPFNVFYQTESRGSKDHSRNYERTVYQVKIPQTKNHFIINSLLNDYLDHGHNLHHYSYRQKIETSESIYKYANILTPKKEEIPILVLLPPNVIAFIMMNFMDADIEIINDQLYVYYYNFIYPKFASSNIEKLDELVGLMKLRKSDFSVSEVNMGEVVARISVEKINWSRLGKLPVSFLQFIVVFILLQAYYLKININSTSVHRNIVFQLLTALGVYFVLRFLFRYVRSKLLRKKLQHETTAFFS